MMTEKVAQHSLTAGDHGTTYGGNPLACAAVEKVLDLFEEDHIIEHVREVAPYLEQRLNELADKYDVPRLVITRENVDEMIAILDTCIE